MDRSLALVGGDLWNVLTRPGSQARAAELFGWIRSGFAKVLVFQAHALRQGADSCRELEARQVIGKIVLLS
jgi:NADPH2:quinone reductase